MNKIKRKYDAIILSSTFGEKEEDIIYFLKHLCLHCYKVSNFYDVIPVIIFENIESKKAKNIKKFFKNEILGVKPKILCNRDSKGFSGCLNYGIKNTKSNFIIRIDTDDKLKGNRIKKQIDIMYSENIDICSGYMTTSKGKLLKYPSKISSLILMIALGNNPLAHPTICLRRKILINNYNNKLKRCEDFELWMRLLLTNKLKFKCLKEPITIYSENNSYKKDKENAYTQIKIRLNYIFKLSIAILVLSLGIIPNIIRILLWKNVLLKLKRRI